MKARFKHEDEGLVDYGRDKDEQNIDSSSDRSADPDARIRRSSLSVAENEDEALILVLSRRAYLRTIHECEDDEAVLQWDFFRKFNLFRGLGQEEMKTVCR